MSLVIKVKACLCFWLLAVVLMGSVIAADQPKANQTTSSDQMASLNQFEVFAKRVLEINFTWNENELADPGLSAGNVGGGNMSALVEAMEKEGFNVQQGRVINLDFLGLVDQELVPNANANNANNPYKTFIFPPLANQSVHPFADINGWSPLYRLRPDEAIVYIGLTPPQSAYFSYQTFMFIHYYPGEGGFKKLFANVGDNINLLTAKTNGTSGDPFNKAIVLISTADKGVNERIKAAAQSANYPIEIMNTEPLPYPLLRMGYGNTSDFYNFGMRVALFKDEQTQKAYADSIPGIVLRVTPTSSTNLDTFGMPTLRVRGTGNLSEFELMGTMDALREAILKKYGAENATDLETHQWLFDGYDAIQRGLDMVGPSRDTIYLNTTPFILSNDSSDFAIVYGINHAAIGKALYSNFNIYGAENLNGVAGINNDKLSGSADEYLPGNPDAKYFYVWKVARHCNEETHCLEVPSDAGAYGIDLNQTAFVGFRAYVEPQTKVGPSYNEILYDRVIKFNPHK